MPIARSAPAAMSPTEMAKAKRSILNSCHRDIGPTRLPAPDPHFAARSSRAWNHACKSWSRLRGSPLLAVVSRWKWAISCSPLSRCRCSGDYRGDTAVAAFLKSGAPDPSWRKGPGATGVMPTTVAASPSPQGHEQRRASSPPQTKFGRGPSFLDEKIMSVVQAQQMQHTKAARGA
jgi:hypothetical protein